MGVKIQKSGSEKLQTIVITHQLQAPRQNSGRCRRRKVQFSELQEISDLDLDLKSDQVHISMRSTYRATSVPYHVAVASSTTEIWPFEIRVNIDIPRSLNSRDSLLRRKFEYRTPTSSKVGLVLSRSTLSFELHDKITEKMDLGKCNFGIFRNFRSPVILTLTLDRVKVTSTCTVRAGLPACLTM